MTEADIPRLIWYGLLLVVIGGAMIMATVTIMERR